jgi:hypothetical protein
MCDDNACIDSPVAAQSMEAHLAVDLDHILAEVDRTTRDSREAGSLM